MIILNTFTFPNDDVETDFLWSIQRTCYDSFYPFKILSARSFWRIDFEPITILYGGNGSGKTTALNVIAEKLNLPRDTIYNKSNFFPNYVQMCSYELATALPTNSRIITSDDVFEYILNIRNLNEGIDQKREALFQDYIETKYSKFQFNSMADYDQLKKVVQVRKNTQSKYVRSTLNDNVREFSNGESAFHYFTEKIEENGLYLLDEPENSLSPKRQIELADYIASAARFFNCQFVISTHSPFLLAMPNAKIYDLDEDPVDCKHWTALENVRTYRDFFLQHDREFDRR
jgi:predicted ATPase